MRVEVLRFIVYDREGLRLFTNVNFGIPIVKIKILTEQNRVTKGYTYKKLNSSWLRALRVMACHRFYKNRLLRNHLFVTLMLREHSALTEAPALIFYKIKRGTYLHLWTQC